MNSITDLLNINNSQDFLNNQSIFVLGTVTDNSDKDHPDMVKVEFTGWANQKSIYEWMPILRSYAGSDYGLYFLPEVDDIVLVSCFGSGQRPFVLGCFYPARSAMATKSFNKKNTNRMLRTKGGIDILLNDEAEKQSVTIKTPKKIMFRMQDGDETALLTDENGDNAVKADCKAGQVTLTAKKKITIKSGKCEISMDGTSGLISIKCGKLEINSSQQTKISAGMMMNVQSDMLKLEGKQTTQIKGGAMTEVSGAMIKLG